MAACVPRLFNRSNTLSADATKPAKSELIKPRVAENAPIGKDNRPGPESFKTASSPPPEKADSKPTRTITAAPEESIRKEPVERATRTVVSKPSEPEPTESKKESEKPVSKDPMDPPEGPLKKFDHVKYMEHMRSRAIDLVNKEPNCSHAILCKDSITEGWSLAIYRIKDGHYTSSILDWDEIDEKWTEAFVSERKPVSQLKEHLKISIIGKECKPLKGTIP